MWRILRLPDRLEADGTTGIVYNGRLDSNGMQFVIRARAVAESGTVTVENGAIKVIGADNVTFYVAGDTDYKMNYNPDFNDHTSLCRSRSRYRRHRIILILHWQKGMMRFIMPIGQITPLFLIE